jgi:hypothetical protein
MMGAMQQQGVTPQSQFIQNQPQQQQQFAPPPPMPPQAPMFHAIVGGVQQGPFAVAQLQQMAQMGQVMPDTMVWCAGMPGWAAAGTVPTLAVLFGAVPPPPPPPPMM